MRKSEMIYKAEIETVDDPTDGYKYNVQQWYSIDGGAQWYYCGHGKFFRDQQDAEAYAAIFTKKEV